MAFRHVRDLRSPRVGLAAAALALGVSGTLGACSSADPRAGFTPPAEEPSAPPAATAPAPTAEPDAAAPAPRDPDEAPAPQAFAVSPDRGVVGAVGPTVAVTGEDFVPRSVLQLDGAPLATTYVSATELRATLPSGRLAAVGVLRLSVGTAAPGGGASKELTFAVENPKPAPRALAPLSVVAGSPAFSLEVLGDGFVQGARVSWGDVELTTTVRSSELLVATVPATLVAQSGAFPVKVTNPPPGGGASSTLSFTVANPAVSISQVTPGSAFVGASSASLRVMGAGFVPASAVLFNGTPLTTAYAGPTELTAVVPGSLLGAVGDLPVVVSSPPPGGGVSAPAVFRVLYPVPSATSVSPSSVAVGSAPTIVVGGAGFSGASQITVDGAPLATTFLDAARVRATLPAATTAAAGVLAVRVVNPSPGGGTSGAVSLTVEHPVPSVASVSPSSVRVGAGDTTFVVTGSGFAAASQIRVDGVALATTFVSVSELRAVVPAARFSAPRALAVTVSTPAPGGGTTSPRTVTVSCDATGVDVSLATETAVELSTLFASATKLSRFVGAEVCEASSLYVDVLEPQRSWVVQNATAAPKVLSAWADCRASGKHEDAYLAFYRRSTKPVTDNERLACTGFISEGKNGIGGFASPEGGISNYCPGLTKANGAGLSLGVCEKVVVHVQAYDLDSTTFPPPTKIKVKVE